MQIENIIGISISVNTEMSPDIYTEYNACIMLNIIVIWFYEVLEPLKTQILPSLRTLMKYCIQWIS